MEVSVRRATLVALVIALAALLFAVEAQAYKSGALIWTKKIGTSSSEASAWAVAAGPNGTTAIAGWQDVSPTGQVPMVAKFGPSGLKWKKTYATPGYAVDVACDRSGNVYVAATINPNTSSDMVLLKYDAAGNLKWERPYDGPANLSDGAAAVGVDRSRNVVIVGTSTVSGFLHGIVLIKYDPAGNALWRAPARFDPDSVDPDSGSMSAYHMAFDTAGNVYVVGYSEYRVSGVWTQSALALKFAAADGQKVWGQVYTARKNTSSYFEDLTIRGTTMACVGSTYGTHNDGLIVKYGLAAGAEKYWKEWGAGNATSEWFGDVVLDAKGNTYVTGDQWLATANGWGKTWTMKLSSSLAKIVWKRYYLPATKRAEGWYIERDGLGNIYVAGVKSDTKGNEDFLTIKYGPTGVRKWLKIWSAGGPDDDEPGGLVLGSTAVFVGGEGTVKGDTYRAVLLKYQR